MTTLMIKAQWGHEPSLGRKCFSYKHLQGEKKISRQPVAMWERAMKGGRREGMTKNTSAKNPNQSDR